MIDPFYLAKIARVFSGAWGVKVVVGGAGSIRSDVGTKTIYLPETISSLPDEMRPVVEGALDHEVAHIRAEEEFPGASAPSYFMKLAPDAAGRLAMNLVEDVRIELDACRRWAGVAAHLEALRDWGFEQNEKALAAGKLGIRHQFVSGFYGEAVTGARRLGSPELNALLDEAAPLVKRAGEATSPAESWAVSVELAEVLRRLALPEEDGSEEPETGSGRSGEEPGEGEGEGKGKGLTHIGTGVTCSHAHGSPGEPGTGAIARLCDLALSKAIGDPTRCIPHPKAARADRVIRPRPGGYPIDLAGASPFVAGLATRLANLLRAQVPCPTRERDTGFLDPGAIAGVLVGERRVFYRPERAERISAAVQVLIDGSGSMDGDRIRYAAFAAYAIGEVLSRVGIPFEILSWEEEDAPIYPTAEERKIYTRINPKTITEFFTFGQDWSRRKRDLGALSAGGCNDDASTIRKVLPRLAARPEKKKILLVLSDGQPAHDACSYLGQAVLNRMLIDAVASAAKVGVRIGGVGICSDAVKLFYPNHVVINKPQDLPAAHLQLFGKLLSP